MSFLVFKRKKICFHIILLINDLRIFLDILKNVTYYFANSR